MKRALLVLLACFAPVLASAQTLTLAPVPWQTFTDLSGNPIAGGCLFTYAAGTTNNQLTYTDSGGVTPNADPIVLDSAGRVPFGFFLSPTSYRFDLYNPGTGPIGCSPAGSLVRSQDNIRSISPFANLDIAGTAGQSLAAGDVVYLSNGSGALTAGRWYKADATNAYSSSTAVSVGMAPNAISVGVSGTIRLSGSVTLPAATLTAGTDYYASGTPGALTSTAPTNARLIGRADTTQSIILAIQSPTPTNLPLGCQGRITLTSGLAVTVSDVTAATTVFYTPYQGSRCALYDGANWQEVSFTEQSLALGTDTTGKNYDLFGFLSSSTLAIERLVWTNDTTRATTLTLVNGIWTKTGDSTRLYLGSYRTTGAGQTEDSAAKRFVWNDFNRVLRPLNLTLSSGTWNYTTAAFRQANATATNQIDFLVGLSEDAMSIQTIGWFANDTGAYGEVGIGIDSTTANNAAARGGLEWSAGAGQYSTVQANLVITPTVGRHTAVWLEFSSAVGTTTWNGANSGIGALWRN